ncbi:MAG: hypothetical protein KatS3mg121_0097 [Gammaproteobacteria bacterium]|nr:MAG: hypothetical protein KatS3mg121_0097 [Gammaproteobacteria bacterium]
MFSCLLWAALPAAVPWLSLPEAERLALAREPALAAAERRAAGLREQAVAAGALPDPQLRVGLMNVPADGYALDRDPMTQRQIALRQAFPPPGMRSARRSVFEARSAAWTAQARARTREVRRAVRHAWLERHYWQAARAVVEQSRSRFEDLLAATRSLYAAGRRNQHDVLRAQLELGRLDDRLFEIDAQAAAAAAELARWVGGAAGRPLPAHLPDWPVPPPETVLRERLAAHPALAAARAQVAAAEAEAETARAAFRPGWGVELAWGERTARDALGVERPDLRDA